MKKFPLRIKLALTISLITFCSCIAMYICVRNSALMKLDSIETCMLQFSTNDISMNISMADLNPEVTSVVENAKTDFTRQCILITILILAMSSTVTFVISKYILKPIHDLSEIVAKTTEHNLYEPLELPEAKDELRSLTQAFNEMRLQLNKAFVLQKQFSSNAAHELRTPLAIMQTSLEVFQKKEGKTIQDYESVINITRKQLERLNHLIHTLLSFQSLHTASLDDTICIPELLDEIACDLHSLSEKRGISMKVNLINDIPDTSGNEGLLYRAYYNLIENAIKYNRENGEIEILIENTEEGIKVTSFNTGTPIPMDQWEKIFEAFYRVDKSRSRKLGGAGLGLALVQEIAVLHHGRVWVEKSDVSGTNICMIIKDKGRKE